MRLGGLLSVHFDILCSSDKVCFSPFLLFDPGWVQSSGKCCCSRPEGFSVSKAPHPPSPSFGFFIACLSGKVLLFLQIIPDSASNSPLGALATLGFSGILSVLNLLYLCFFLFPSLDCQFSVVQGNVWLAF